MTRCARAATFAALSILWCAATASAETLRCQSVNGNVNCAGPSGVSCQTVNGRKVCVSGDGAAVQSFGNTVTPDQTDDGADDSDVPPSGPTTKQRLEQHGPGGHELLLERDGTQLHLRTNWLSIDRD